MSLHFTTGPVKLAYEILGSGEPTLVVVPGWVSHLGLDRETPVVRDLYERLAQHRRMVHYDKRGTGLSDRPSDPDAFTLETRVADLATVMDAAGVRRAAILGWSEGGPIAIAFAARYPERVSHLILYGTAARALRDTDYPCGNDPAEAAAFTALVAAEWGLGSRALALLFLPEGDGGHAKWFVDYQRAGVSPQGAVASRHAWYAMDVRALLPTIQQPALVLHRRDEPTVLARGEHLAAHLPNARLEVLEGDQHLPWFGDSVAFTDAIDRFLAEPEALAPVANPPDRLTRREREVASLVARGMMNREIAGALYIGERTVHTHVSNLLAKLGLSARTEIAIWAREHGLCDARETDGFTERPVRLVR